MQMQPSQEAILSNSPKYGRLQGMRLLQVAEIPHQKHEASSMAVLWFDRTPLLWPWGMQLIPACLSGTDLQLLLEEISS